MGSIPTDEWEPHRPAHDEVFVAAVSERADDVATCSISPLPRSEQALASEWISATGSSFVSLDEMR